MEDLIFCAVTSLYSPIRPEFRYTNSRHFDVSINPYMANVAILFCLKTSENRSFCIFRRYKMGTLARNGLTLSVPTPKNGQTHSNNSSRRADELVECV